MMAWGFSGQLVILIKLLKTENKWQPDLLSARLLLSQSFYLVSLVGDLPSRALA